MSIKPIDMQVTIARSNEIGKQKNDEQSKNNFNQQQQALTNQEQVDKKLTRVNTKEETKGKVITHKENGEKEKQQGSNKKQKRNPGDAKHVIDIEV